VVIDMSLRPSFGPQMPFLDFLESSGDPTQYLYYTAPLENWAPSGLHRDVQWELFKYKPKVSR
jgi:hypothetical protein